MPTYCYQSADGDVIDRFYTKPDGVSWMEWDGPPRTIRKGGKVYARSLEAEQCTLSVDRYNGGGYKLPFGAQVRPHQAPMLRRFLKEKGVRDVTVTERGEVVCHSRRGENDHNAARGLIDPNGDKNDYRGTYSPDWCVRKAK